MVIIMVRIGVIIVARVNLWVSHILVTIMRVVDIAVDFIKRVRIGVIIVVDLWASQILAIVERVVDTVRVANIVAAFIIRIVVILMADIDWKASHIKAVIVKVVDIRVDFVGYIVVTIAMVVSMVVGWAHNL